MRTAVSTIQQTLTAEAAAILTRSISEASRRSHGQTTPLHVAATLLAAPSGVLRQACLRSHPQTSHPLQSRALDLCFTIALDRLPSTATSAASAEPPISNALMAALKRAQAHQRRGCPEQQQQPLLAVKVELEQLIISILDDPSVSRVMREASFNSSAVKAVVEQSLASSAPSAPPAAAGLSLSVRSTALAPASSAAAPFNHPNRNLYANPRLLQQQQPMPLAGASSQPKTAGDEVKKVMDILVRSKKRNPVLVGDSDLDSVMKEVLQRIETGTAPAMLASAKVISFGAKLSGAVDRAKIPGIIREFAGSIEADAAGFVVNLGDLKWLVESSSSGGGGLSGLGGAAQTQGFVSETGCAAVAEMASLLKRFEECGRLWIVGTASCATYLRCQVYYPSMENDWDIQAVPIAPRSRAANVLPRYGGNGILSSSVETLAAPAKGIATSFRPQLNIVDSSPTKSLCPACTESYEQELAKLVAKECEKSTMKPDADKGSPQWLQLAKPKEQDLLWKQSTEELLKRWRETCSRLHPSPRPMLHDAQRSLASSRPLSFLSSRPPLEPSLSLSQSHSFKLTKDGKENAALEQPSKQEARCPGSPVKTDLELGNLKFSNSLVEKDHRERVKDLAGCTQDYFFSQQKSKTSSVSDIDSYKHFYKGLIEKVPWQQEAASAVASVAVVSKSGSGRRTVGATKGNTWLLFVGPDKVGKMKMASALSELAFTGGPTVVSFGSSPSSNDEESNFSSRGRTAIDRVVEAVRRNPFSVIVLEDLDQADSLVQGVVKRAIESGRLPDSYGREVSLGSVIFIITSSWMPDELKSSYRTLIQREEELCQLAGCEWNMELSAGNRPVKRHGDCLGADEQPFKMQKQSTTKKGLSLDLNLAAGMDYEAGEGSGNSSDLSFEHEHDKGKLAIKFSVSSIASELMKLVDNSIMFKPVDFGPLRKNISDSISRKFATVIGNGRSIKVDDEALDQIVAGVWFSGSVFEEWAERVFMPSLNQLKFSLKANDTIVVVRLSVTKGCRGPKIGTGDCLPRTVALAID